MINSAVVHKIVILFIVLLPISQLQAAKPFGITGTDDREVVKEKGSPWNAIGRINISKLRYRISCTGTLIAPDKVLTAAHCVRDNGQFARLDQLRFVAGVNGSKNQGQSKIKCIHMPEYREAIKQNITGRGLIARDIAVLVLKKKLKVPPLSIHNPNGDLSKLSITHPGYPRDRSYILSAHRNCKIREKYPDIWVTDCDTNHGSSGGPLLAKIDGQFQIVGLMVAVLDTGENSVALPLDDISKRLSTIQCPRALKRDTR